MFEIINICLYSIFEWKYNFFSFIVGNSTLQNFAIFSSLLKHAQRNINLEKRGNTDEKLVE